MSIDKIIRCKSCESTYVSSSPSEEVSCRYCGTSLVEEEKKEESKESTLSKDVHGVMFSASMIVYFFMGIAQLAAIMSGLEHWGLNLFFRLLLGGIVAYIPILGTIAGIIGAYKGWGWNIFTSIALFSIFPILLSILAYSSTHFISDIALKFSVRWERVPNAVKWGLAFPVSMVFSGIVGFLFHLLAVSTGWSRLGPVMAAPLLGFLFISLCKNLVPNHKARVVKTILQLRFLFVPLLILLMILKVANGQALNWKEDYSVFIGEIITFIVYRTYFLSLPNELGLGVSKNIFSKKFSVVVIVFSVIGFLFILSPRSRTKARQTGNVQKLNSESVVIQCQTDRHVIKIKKMEDESFSYLAWDKKDNSEKPSIIIHNGKIQKKESKGCVSYIYGFPKGNYEYGFIEGECFETSSPKGYVGGLIVVENKKIITNKDCFQIN